MAIRLEHVNILFEFFLYDSCKSIRHEFGVCRLAIGDCKNQIENFRLPPLNALDPVNGRFCFLLHLNLTLTKICILVIILQCFYEFFDNRVENVSGAYGTGTHGFARSVPIIYFLLALLVMIGLRRVVAAIGIVGSDIKSPWTPNPALAEAATCFDRE